MNIDQIIDNHLDEKFDIKKWIKSVFNIDKREFIKEWKQIIGVFSKAIQEKNEDRIWKLINDIIDKLKGEDKNGTEIVLTILRLVNLAYKQDEDGKTLDGLFQTINVLGDKWYIIKMEDLGNVFRQKKLQWDVSKIKKEKIF